MKKYVQPMTTVVNVAPHGQILDGSAQNVQYIDNNAQMNFGGGSNQAARVKGTTVEWDDWE